MVLAAIAGNVSDTPPAAIKFLVLRTSESGLPKLPAPAEFRHFFGINQKNPASPEERDGLR